MREKLLNGINPRNGRDFDSWEFIDNKIKNVFKFNNFKEAMNFVNKIASLSEKENHHPNINIDYNKVGIIVWTHSENKSTEKDFKLAKGIDKINENNPCD